MKIQEAIKEIKSYADNSWGGLNEAFEMAINALEKQIPKRPINTRQEIVCPTCRTLVGSSPYCRYCGQMLDHTTHPTEKGGGE